MIFYNGKETKWCSIRSSYFLTSVSLLDKLGNIRLYKSFRRIDELRLLQPVQCNHASEHNTYLHVNCVRLYVFWQKQLRRLDCDCTQHFVLEYTLLQIFVIPLLRHCSIWLVCPDRIIFLQWIYLWKVISLIIIRHEVNCGIRLEC